MRTAYALTVALCLGCVQLASADYSITLTRNSRAVTTAEAAGGAPVDGMVHDLYVTSNADLLSLSTHFNQSVYQHPYGSDNSAPAAELIAYYPAAAADSFFTMPSSTQCGASSLSNAWKNGES